MMLRAACTPCPFKMTLAAMTSLTLIGRLSGNRATSSFWLPPVSKKKGAGTLFKQLQLNERKHRTALLALVN